MDDYRRASDLHHCPCLRKREGPVLINQGGMLIFKCPLIMALHAIISIWNATSDAFLPKGMRTAPVEVDDINPVENLPGQGFDAIADSGDAVLFSVRGGDAVHEVTCVEKESVV